MLLDVGPKSNDGHPDEALRLAASSGDGMSRQNQRLAVSPKVAGDQVLKPALSALQRGPIRFRRNQVIACEGDSADYVFFVVSGVIRGCKTFQNGDRTIIAFYLPGDLFGWDPETRPLSIEAASDALVTFIKRQGLVSLAERDRHIADLLHSTIAKEIQRLQLYATTMSISAKDRFLAFLRDWSKRSGTSHFVHLSIGHQDIADHLGITIETVSRTVTELERSGVLARSTSRRLMLRRPL